MVTQVRPMLNSAYHLISLDRTDRRVLILSNPAVFPEASTTNNLYVSYQLVGPGETAQVHRHTPGASRFILEGEGGYTVVEGEKCPMSRGDLILTPQGTWHDHGNDGSAPAIWVDVLDLPLVAHMGAIHFDFAYGEASDPRGEPIARRTQSVRIPADHSTNLYGKAGLLPTFIDRERGAGQGTPKYVYPWSETREALERLKKYDGSRFDGIALRYTDPTTAESVTPTMDFVAQMLRPGEATAAHRHTSSTVYCCLEGMGRSIVDGKEIVWGRNDIFTVPTLAWHEHENGSSTESAILYAVTDAPVARMLRVYHEQTRDSDGEINGIEQEWSAW